MYTSKEIISGCSRGNSFSSRNQPELFVPFYHNFVHNSPSHHCKTPTHRVLEIIITIHFPIHAAYKCWRVWNQKTHLNKVNIPWTGNKVVKLVISTKINIPLLYNKNLVHNNEMSNYQLKKKKTHCGSMWQLSTKCRLCNFKAFKN